MRWTIAIVVLVMLLGRFDLASQEAGLKPHCKHTDKTDPKALTGEHGAKESYHLSWTTDADKLDGKYEYIRILANISAEKLLPAKWEKANMEFEEKKPLDCFRNKFESGYPPKEEAKTMILYGQRLEKTCEASLYVKDDTDPKKDISKGKQLKSSLVASNFDFSFSSTIIPEKRPTITYTAVGRNITFKIDGLTKQLNALKKKKSIGVQTSWRTNLQGDRLIPGTAEGDKESMYVVGVFDDRPIVERQFQIEIFSEKDKSLAKGLVTAYVPGDKQ